MKLTNPFYLTVRNLRGSSLITQDKQNKGQNCSTEQHSVTEDSYGTATTLLYDVILR